ncbi:MAG: hypothetical protein C0404_08570 [Verrucomicrobia bacterium]|nr:hypothetical protein [Verrucomicrobiota bacterium]
MIVQLSITTDYRADTGNPEPYLRRIADAGFTHVHWCHHWNTDFVYSMAEISRIGEWLSELGLKLLDLHGSVGPEKNWFSGREYERLAGVELVRNRIEMTARLGGDAVVMHTPNEPGSDPLRRSLDEIRGYAAERKVRLAIENGRFEAIRPLLKEYGPEYVGICYDSGHGNMDAGGIDELRLVKDRLICIHLHDNDGTADQHKPLFSGSVHWPALARIVAESSYKKPVSMECSMRNAGFEEETAFLDHAFRTGARFARMVEDERKGL